MSDTAPTNAARILVIDDEPDLRTLYTLTLLRAGYAVESGAGIQEAWSLLETQAFDLVITDMRLPDGNGAELLRGLRAQRRAERCIVITAYGSAENAVESLKAGAFDYLTKPVDLKQFRSVVAAAVKHPSAFGPEADAQASPRPQAPAGPAANAAAQAALARLAGDSLPMRTVRERIVRIAASMAPVMVHGESGTGKELVAQALHANSHRAQGPWIAVNCGAIPENLLEAEFFGARKGAYTGAASDREGYFQAADGGTLFLDEIGDLPLAMQAKLLRAIQERRVRPLGANQEHMVDVRIVSATHKDLSAEVAAGRFRQDLFYRLNVIDITIPPLRERSEDLPTLCAVLLARIAAESGTTARTLSPHTIARLAVLPLRGNVRELENILHRSVALGEDEGLVLQESADPAGGEVAPSPVVSIPPPAEVAAELPKDLQEHLDQQERQILVAALRGTGFNRTLAAKLLGLSLRQIRYRIARLKIETPFGHEADADD